MSCSREREGDFFFVFVFAAAHTGRYGHNNTLSSLSLPLALLRGGRVQIDGHIHTDGRERERLRPFPHARARGAPSSGADRRTAFPSDSPPNRLRPLRLRLLSFLSLLLILFFFFFFFFSVCDAIALPHLVRLCPYSHSLLRDSSFANLLFVLGHLRAHREKKDPKQKNNSTFLGKKKKIQDGEISQSGWLRWAMRHLRRPQDAGNHLWRREKKRERN